ncbi:Two-component response regulator, SAPR family, consists of REC, wHTH and BTAD domains [Lutibacter agarilyticus]|uniref:Two-component response regulator, SAPR family, consists of REC, wHTH and BTAD domains n=1 Tax=Lutibacter agarilyticus TaxID=1109740 RepID=A0A238WB70_9FLAO|nr:hypothetical protein [Lutibacter agarilyticus]SNR43802.1 Two-component response regulator, SAPR family, consists of REC, wHTH and BTAD domains [Lutibacter agarilyticus]
MFRQLLLLLSFLFSSIFYGQGYLDEGLFFSSHEVNQDKRTSLNLTPEDPFHFDNAFSIEFEANFRKGDGYYGNIFKIIGNEGLNIDLIANLDDENENFWLVVQDTILFKYKWSDILEGDFYKWIKFNLFIDIENSSLTLSINGDKIIKKIALHKDLEDFEINFGKNLNKNFATTDVCPMSIKNIKVFDNNKLVRNWILGKHTSSNIVYDETNNHIAVVSNPTWLMDEHLFWKKTRDFNFENLLGSAQDEFGQRIFFIDKKAVYVYSVEMQTLDTLTYKGSPYILESNTFIYNPNQDEIWSYSFEDNSISKFDFKSSTWSFEDVKINDVVNYWHHNNIISPIDSSLITFGGYGYYKYKSDLKQFNLKNSSWKTFDKSTSIEPRYLSSSGILNKDKFLIFGGYGNSNGNQNLGSQHFYDLFTVDFKSLEVKKLWDLTNVKHAPFVPVESMVVDSNSDSFFTLIYDNTTFNTNLRLAQFKIDQNEMVVFPDSIPYKFLDIKSRSSLFLNPSQSKLYALNANESNVNLYSLSYPPLLISDIFQEEIKPNKSFWDHSWIIAILSGLVVLIILLIWFKKKAKLVITNEKEEIELKKEAQRLAPSISKKIKQSAIYLHGGFQVYDIDGNDMTAMFTPTLKHLFIIILLSASKNEKGVSSIKLTDILWYDKSENSARNNRNVNISKLRILLDKIGDIEITNDNSYWKMNIGDNVFCDYSFVINLLNNSSGEPIKDNDIHKLLTIVSRGQICPDIQTDWIDDFKNYVSNLLIDNLELISKTQTDLHLNILIAETILKYDPLSEVALSLQCKSLYNLGKKGLAKKCYNHYCKEYLELLDSKFDKTFKNIIE